MQVQKVQSNQPIFGTQVRISSIVGKMMAGSHTSKKMLEQIKALEQNGKNDILTLTGSPSNIPKGELISFHKCLETGTPYMVKQTGYVDLENLAESYKSLCALSTTKAEKRIQLFRGAEQFFSYFI